MHKVNIDDVWETIHFQTNDGQVLLTEQENITLREKLAEMNEKIDIGLSSKPMLTSQFPKVTNCATSDKFEITYFFSSPKQGKGTAIYSIDGEETTQEIMQGKNVWKVGPFEKGTRVLSITVKDSAGDFTAVPLYFTFNVGALEISSSFDDSIDFTLSDEITIQYEVDSISETVEVEYILDGISTKGEVERGTNFWKVGYLPLGPHKLSIQATSPGYTSNILEFDVVVTNTDELYLSTTFVSGTKVPYGKTLYLDYRISIKGHTRFKTKMYINNILQREVDSRLGLNYWDIDGLQGGRVYSLKIEAQTADGTIVCKQPLTLLVEVVEEDGFEATKPVVRGLVASFNTKGRSNNESNLSERAKWRAQNNENIYFDLIDYNFSTNGWIDGQLKFNGESYAKMNYKPFADNIASKGFTFEILYKTRNVGDIDAKVAFCAKEETPFNGIFINTMQAKMSSVARGTGADFDEEAWTRQTFIIDREVGAMAIYTNAILTRYVFIQPGENFTLDDFLYLGCGVDKLGKPKNNSSCEIKYIRLYNVALTKDEVLQNFIAETDDVQEHKHLQELNYVEGTMPTMEIVADDPQALEDLIKRTDTAAKSVKLGCTISYFDPSDPTTRITEKKGCKIQLQGTSSIKYAVKNFKIDLGKDPDDPDKSWEYSPKPYWPGETKFTLKADYMESSHANNVGTAKFVEDFFKNDLPPQIQQKQEAAESGTVIDKPIRNAIDGFPMLLKVNGVYRGIYMFNIDKNAKNCFGFTSKYGKVKSYEMSANSDGGAASFQTDAWESIAAEYEVRYHWDEKNVIDKETEIMLEGKHPELQRLITWTCHSTDEEFKRDVREYWDLESLIDYFLMTYTFGMVDNLGKNCMIATWDDKIWYPSFYDMDTMMGLDNSGYLMYGPDVDLDRYNSGQSRLWQKLQRNFMEEIKTRYSILRQKKLTLESALNCFEKEIISKIGQRYYNDDAYVKYIAFDEEYMHMCNGTRLEWTRRWIKERLMYIDSKLGYGPAALSCVVRSNVPPDMTDVVLKIKTYSPMWITVSFSDSNDEGSHITKYVGKDAWTEFKGRPSSSVDNNISITGAPNIMYIDGIKAIQPSTLLFANAEKIVEIDCSGSPHLKKVDLKKNYLLQKANFSECINLGSIDNSGTLNVSECTNLKFLDISKTQIRDVVFNPSGGALTYLSCENSPITQLVINGQGYLKEINLIDCADLDTVRITDCGRLLNLDLPNSKVSNMHIEDCVSLTHLDMSFNGYLKEFSMINCSGLEDLKMSGVVSETIRELNLRDCRKLKYLDISKCDYLKGVNFPGLADPDNEHSGYSALLELICNDSGVEYFKYGISNEEPPKFIDLSSFNLDTIDFTNCRYLKEIRGLNFYAKGSCSPFNGCRSLVAIKGYLKLVDNIAYAFSDCRNLDFSTLELDLTQVTDAYSAFATCEKLTLAQLYDILKQCHNLENAYYMFARCTGIKSDLNNPLPSDLFRTTDEGNNCNSRIRNASEMFLYCTNMGGELPAELLYPIPLLETTYGMFRNTIITGAIPTQLLSRNLFLKTVESMFHDAKIDTMPGLVFNNNSELESIDNFMANCGARGTLEPRLLFSNYNLKKAKTPFLNCEVYGGVPADMFVMNSQLETIEGFFMFGENNGIRGEIPPDLLLSCKKLESASHLFSGAKSLSGLIPEGLIPNTIVSVDGMFEGCIGLGNTQSSNEFPTTILHGKTKLLSAKGMFKGCTGLMFNLDANIFKDCVALKDISSFFEGCKKLNGSIPADIFSPIIPNAISGIFKGCENLGMDGIPSSLFDTCGAVTDMSDIFNGCKSLRGSVPEQLFLKCGSIRTLNNAFNDCINLGNRDVGPSNPYAIPPSLFASCYSLINVNNLFSKCASLIGELPDSLFRNCPNIESLTYSFHATPITGYLTGNMFSNNKYIKDMSGLFYGCSGLSRIEPTLLTAENHRYIVGLDSTFRECVGLTGEAPKLWVTHTSATRAYCFTGCTKLSNYSEIPEGWGGPSK